MPSGTITKPQIKTMKVSFKVGSQFFIHLDEGKVYFDKNGESCVFSLPKTPIDIFFSEPNILEILTSDCHAITVDTETGDIINDIGFKEELISGSIWGDHAIVINKSNEVLEITFDGKIVNNFEFPNKNFYCLLTSKIRVVADYTRIYYNNYSSERWYSIKLRDYHIQGIFNTNRGNQFGILTSIGCKLFRNGYVSDFKSWARSTISMIQCPSSKMHYAHLSKEGLLKVGDASNDFAFQEVNITGICWDLGILWVRNQTGQWKKALLVYQGQIYDLRATSIESLAHPVKYTQEDSVAEIVTDLANRPGVSKEVYSILPSVSHHLVEGRIIKEASDSLNSYINQEDEIYQLLGKIDLVLS